MSHLVDTDAESTQQSIVALNGKIIRLQREVNELKSRLTAVEKSKGIRHVKKTSTQNKDGDDENCSIC